MLSARVAATASLTVLGFLATGPAAHALPPSGTLQGTLTSSPGTLTRTAQNLTFKGFNAANFPGLNASHVLTKVSVHYVLGTKGGNVTFVNGSGGPVDVFSPGDLGIRTNGQSLFLQAANGTATNVPDGNSATVAVTPGPQTYIFDIWRVAPPLTGNPLNSAAAFSTASVSLPANTRYILDTSDGDYSPSGANQGATFALNSLPANTFLEFTYVPGPLPLLGAGAAFGWSRRLRKRISNPA